jgi:cell division protein ZapA (FtsZ GTPase activity inhibitor)
MKDSTPPPIIVEIFGGQYQIRPTDNLTEDDIRKLANYVDHMMRQTSEMGYDRHNATILAALNIAFQLHGERKQLNDFIHHLVQVINAVVEEEPENDTTSDPSASDQEA